MQKPLRGLFLNTERAICSIYESGKMSYDCLARSENYSLDYVELSEKKREITLGYDFYIFNYHWVKMGWLDTKRIKQLSGFKATLVLEMSQNSPFDCVSQDDFDAYLVLDPTCKHFLPNVYSFPRPLEIGFKPIFTSEIGEIPVVGTFGLSFSDKGFDEVIKAANQEFDAVTVRINVPNSENATTRDRVDFRARLADLSLKKNVKVELSDHYFNKEELINWCAKNTLNAFLYNRRVGNGLSATTDQAIASGRPLTISTNPTFRHIHRYIKPYPYLSLRESIDTTAPLVKAIQEDWNPRNFMLRFETVLKENNIRSRDTTITSKAKLPALNNLLNTAKKLFSKRGVTILIPPIFFKLGNKLKGTRKANDAPALRPFIHQALLSSSQFQEDLLVDLLLGGKKEGVYVDVGADDPFFNSNTRRFYLRGWRGINIASGVSEFKKFLENRTLDINLNLVISNAMPLSRIFDTYLGDRHIDFMSIDAGGHDLSALGSNKWDKYRPTLVMIGNITAPLETIMYMDKHGYLYIFSNHVSALFVDKTTTDKNVVNCISWGN